MSASRLTRLPSGRRSAYLVLMLWLVLVAVAAPLALKLTSAQDNAQLGALPGSAQARQAQDRIAAAFPDSRALVAVAVYVRDSGITAADRAKVAADRAQFARYARDPGVRDPGVGEAIPSADGTALLLSFPLAGTEQEQSTAAGQIRDRLGVGLPPGLQTALTGSAGANGDFFDAFAGLDTTLLLATGLVVAFLLIVTYRSPVMWLIPLIAVAVASQVADAVVYLLAQHAGLTVDFQSQNILTVLVFGVGVDYALLLIARYRQELRRRPDRHQAMAHAVQRCIPAIAASAATVAVSLLCLLAADLPSTRGLGPVAAVGVVVAFAVMTTLLPAVLVIFGRWLFWPFVPRVGQDDAATGRVTWWGRVADVVGRRPRLVGVGTGAALIAVSFGVGNLSIGMPGDEYFTTPVGSITGQHLLADHYPGGTTSPADIVAAAWSATAVVDAARAVPGVAEVGDPQRSADGRWVRVAAVLDAPGESAAATATVGRLRSALDAVPNAQALVGGEAAVTLDTERVAARDNRVVMPLILLVVLAILALLLRALVAPLVLLVSVVVSYVAALGAAALILTAIGHPRLWVGIPLQTFLFLVALGIDYTIFLMTRAREEVAGLGHRAGVLQALSSTGGVITSAGVVLAATFSALAVMPLVPSIQTAVIVAAGVLLDTMVVRSLLVPAVVVGLGRRTWWPGPLPGRGGGHR